MEKKEILEPALKPDNLTRTESIKTNEQNQDHAQALASNPDQFPSIADLRIPIPNKDQIEPFQIIEDGKTIAASRKVVHPVMDSFNQGLRALPEDATDEQQAAYQIDYIMRKTGEKGLLLKTGITENHDLTEPKNLYDQIITALDGYAQECKERNIGTLIGTIEGIGNVAVSLATVADFGAALILNDIRKASDLGAQFGQSVGTAIASGIKLFSAANQYLYDVGFQGDYSKPFKDISTVASALNAQWSRLSPKEQERLKAKLITELLADSLIGMPGARAIEKAGKYTEVLEIVAHNADRLAHGNTFKTANKIAQNIEEIGKRSMKMTDLPKNAIRPELQMAEPDLLKTMAKNARREVTLVEPGSDMDRYMTFMNASGLADGTKIFLKPGTTKIATLEEYLHGTQFLHGWRGKIPDEILEVKVKDFMIRHHKLLGLEPGDVDYLKLLKEAEIQRALRRGYSPIEIEGRQWGG